MKKVIVISVTLLVASAVFTVTFLKRNLKQEEITIVTQQISSPNVENDVFEERTFHFDPTSKTLSWMEYNQSVDKVKFRNSKKDGRIYSLYYLMQDREVEVRLSEKTNSVVFISGDWKTTYR